MIRVQRKVGGAVLQHDAAPARNHAGTEHAVEAVDQRRRVAFGIDRADINGISGEAAVGGHLVPGERAGGIDQRPPLVGVGARKQSLDRNIGERGIRDPAVAVMVGKLLRLHQEVHVVRAQVFHCRKIIGLDQVQHLQHRDTLRGRRSLVQPDAAIVGKDRFPPLRALRAKVGFGEEPAVRARIARELLRDLALVIGSTPAGADRFDGAREIGVDQGLARARRRAAF